MDEQGGEAHSPDKLWFVKSADSIIQGNFCKHIFQAAGF